MNQENQYSTIINLLLKKWNLPIDLALKVFLKVVRLKKTLEIHQIVLPPLSLKEYT